MFSMIAHDLTRPFSSILGFSKLLAMEFKEYENENHIQFSQLIYESSKTLLTLGAVRK
jgi:signal transduction histidine kinase